MFTTRATINFFCDHIHDIFLADFLNKKCSYSIFPKLCAVLWQSLFSLWFSALIKQHVRLWVFASSFSFSFYAFLFFFLGTLLGKSSYFASFYCSYHCINIWCVLKMRQSASWWSKADLEIPCKQVLY